MCTFVLNTKKKRNRKLLRTNYQLLTIVNYYYMAVYASHLQVTAPNPMCGKCEIAPKYEFYTTYTSSLGCRIVHYTYKQFGLIATCWLGCLCKVSSSHILVRIQICILNFVVCHAMIVPLPTAYRSNYQTP